MITPKLLRQYGACEAQYEVFKSEWPRGCAVTIKNALRAVELDLDLNWLAMVLFRGAIRTTYIQDTAPTRIAYEKAHDAAWYRYVNAHDAAWNAYAMTGKINLEEYGQALDTAWDIFRQEEQPALDVFHQAQVYAFVKGYNQSKKARGA